MVYSHLIEPLSDPYPRSLAPLGSSISGLEIAELLNRKLALFHNDLILRVKVVFQEQSGAATKTVKKQASCQRNCPGGIDVPRYIRAISSGNFDESLAVIREAIPFPSVCGYACYAPCEPVCARGQLDKAVSIRILKKFAAEHGGESWKDALEPAPATDRKVAIVGAGPAGLTAAYFLAIKGHDVTVFERKSEPGGMLRWAIPEYRLPHHVLKREIDEIRALGVKIRTGEEVESLQELKDGGYQAVFISCGSQNNVPLGIPGGDSAGIIGTLAFLSALNAGEPIRVGRRVAVIGGGNVAIDAARSAVRLGAEDVTIYYRRTRNEMPAYPHEIDAALAEGVKIVYLAEPAAIEEQENAFALKVAFNCMEMGSPDKSGRARPEPVRGRGFTEEFDTVISAIGQQVAFPYGLAVAVEGNGYIQIDENSLSTNVEGVFAGGDVIGGTGSIIKAIGDGKAAASHMDKFLGGDGDISVQLVAQEAPVAVDARMETPGAPMEIPCSPGGSRVSGFEVIEQPLSPFLARTEADRCLWCDHLHFEVDLDFEGCKSCGYCREVCHLEVFGLATGFNAKGYRPFEVVNTRNCTGCMKCFYICPDFCIDIKEAV